jgi:hypothetical protein
MATAAMPTRKATSVTADRSIWRMTRPRDPQNAAHPATDSSGPGPLRVTPGPYGHAPGTGKENEARNEAATGAWGRARAVGGGHARRHRRWWPATETVTLSDPAADWAL